MDIRVLVLHIKNKFSKFDIFTKLYLKNEL